MAPADGKKRTIKRKLAASAKSRIAKTAEKETVGHKPTEKELRQDLTYPQVGPGSTQVEIPPTGEASHPADDRAADELVIQHVKPSQSPFLIVGIGASAGGLEAFENFFRNMPPDSGMAFVLIPHLDPSHTTHLPELVQRTTLMPVNLVKDRLKVRPNNVYIIPPNWIMGILHGNLHLVRRYDVTGGVSTINYFMQTLAEDQGENAVCIILSGMGSDGSKALPKVKSEFGLTIAQDPATAKYSSMPKSAIDTTCVDAILSPEQMPQYLLDYTGRTDRKSRQLVELPSEQVSDNLEKTFLVLRSSTGHDFSSYKRSTILRRIQRRMAVHQVTNMKDYVNFLVESSDEAKRLMEDLLIGVTRFFRDPEAFEALKLKGLVPLLKNITGDQVIRVWIPGCSGGEEPYSIAMLLQECFEEIGRDFDAQVFATDIDNYAIEKARVGLYPDTITEDVGPDRLKKFFTKEGEAYRVKPSIRQMLVFAPQNVIKDPPFTKLDLLCCRNLLIYFDAELQKRLMPLFHYSIRTNGLLFLGTSETVGGFSEYFGVVDKRWKIYQRRDVASSGLPPLDFAIAKTPQMPVMPNQTKPAAPTFSREVERHLLQIFAPPSAVIDSKGEVLYVHGRTGNYLEPAAGSANWNIVEMAREGLKLPLSSAIRKSASMNKETTLEGVKVKNNGGHILVNISVRPADTVSSPGLFLVTFERAVASRKEPRVESRVSKKSSKYIQELEFELKRTKEHLRTSIEELETANEELRSINEEYQSTNEELQSSNEELNTSREELQSLNEELETVNAEYQNQIQLLQSEDADLHDLLESLQVPTIVLDSQLRIKRFTSSIARIVNVISSDIGRPLSDIVHRLDYQQLVTDAGEVLSTLVPKLASARSADGSFYHIIVRPLRSGGNVIGGVVISFFDITQQQMTRQQLIEANQNLESERKVIDNVLDTLREGLLLLDEELRVSWANRSFYDLFHTSPEDTIDCPLYELGNRQWDSPQLRQLLEEILPKRTVLHDYEVTHSFPTIGTRTVILNARQLNARDGSQKKILLAIEDVTKRQPQ